MGAWVGGRKEGRKRALSSQRDGPCGPARGGRSPFSAVGGVEEEVDSEVEAAVGVEEVEEGMGIHICVFNGVVAVAAGIWFGAWLSDR